MTYFLAAAVALAASFVAAGLLIGAFKRPVKTGDKIKSSRQQRSDRLRVVR